MSILADLQVALPAKSASKSECISTMKSTFEEEVKKI